MFDRVQTLTLATSKDSSMVAFKDYIINYDRKLIQFDESDNISEAKNPSKDLKWLDLNEAEDHFDEFLYPIAQEITRDFSESKDQSIVYDHHWLMHKVKRHIADFLGDSGGLDYRQSSLAILEFLIAGNQDLQDKLVDLLGFSDLDFITELMANKDEIVQTITTEASNLKQSQSVGLNASTEEIEKSIPSYGAQVTVLSQSAKDASRIARKERKKIAKKDKDKDLPFSSLFEFDGEYLKNAREEQLEENSLASTLNSGIPKAIKYPHVYDDSAGGALLSAFGSRYKLPARAVRVDEKDFEKISIPVVSTWRSDRKRLPITSLHPFVQKGFEGYDSLNPVQSIVYPTVFETTENILVCAPTGAGKTDIAMLSILRCIHQHTDESGRISKSDFKIVYIAPMKALAAEITRKFSKRLKCFNLTVKELTGDMQLTKAEIIESQMLVLTPEKFDIVGRKSIGDTELMQKIRLLIIDEVHLLNEDRGSVIETIVARTQRYVESSQTMIRIVGLSATLPNYLDVASFLGVNPFQGLFFFDSSYRPIPLEQNFIGVKAKAGSISYRTKLNEICFEQIISLRKDNRQAMIFVHSRKDTVKTSQDLRQEALNRGNISELSIKDDPKYGLYLKEVQKSRNKELKDLFEYGMGIHHAGMTRSDRQLTERLFELGAIKVLCCTATLAWGVNLPAYAVIIKGTTIYDATKGGFVDLSILDVLQIFGRAGRPQFEDKGVGYILTSHDKLSHYITTITQRVPIESRFVENLEDNLNAEVSLGTVTNVDEAIRWLSYTYFFVRIHKNPFRYGIGWKEVAEDPQLIHHRQSIISIAARKLHNAQMVVFDSKTGFLTPKDLGRIASSFYISTKSIETFNSYMKPRMTEADVLKMLTLSSEFENLKVRDEEFTELKKLEKTSCACDVDTLDSFSGKANVLLQSYISRSYVDDFALISDTAYVSQNSSRILRALFQIALSRSWGPTASVILTLSKGVDRKMWSFETPLRQFDLPHEILNKLEKLPQSSVESLKDISELEIGELIRNKKMGSLVNRCLHSFPLLSLEANVSPITRTVLKIQLSLKIDFVWNDKINGMVEPFHIWVEDGENIEILYSDSILIHKKQRFSIPDIDFTIPIPKVMSTTDELPPQIFIRAISDRWVGSESIIPVSFKHLILPAMHHSTFTDLLDLNPLPISALNNPILEEICQKRFRYFNPVQTQIFHTLYYTPRNALIGAPTGSGKTVAAELALWAAFRDYPESKVVYIAPLKALVKERVKDWRKRISTPLGRNLVELTGDFTPDLATIESSDIIITTPEKWDGVSRSWKSRKYVKKVSLVIIDEIHLLGNERGPILEVIVTRMNYIASQTGSSIRIVGLSTALANAIDLADWLQIKHIGLFNFRHNVRPVPLEIYIDGFSGKHYCPRMMSMNKPAYKAIMTHSPDKPVIIFVSSRRQTRLTAQDLISLCANDDNPRRFIQLKEEEVEIISQQIKDVALKHSLAFGIGLHHAGLVEKDRQIVEDLFTNGKIQILVATSTLAWGVNFPAHLVIVKGTEFFDAKKKGYVDYPITDVLQMMGRAGRIQYSDKGVAKIFVLDKKKDFYKKFLHEPFPVESSLHKCLQDHLNAEIVAGTITDYDDILKFLTCTYLHRRLVMNPTYYGAIDASDAVLSEFLKGLIDHALGDLLNSDCITKDENDKIVSTEFGRIASYYYLQHRTVKMLKKCLVSSYNEAVDFMELLRILSNSLEYSELPVRHNEDQMNRVMDKNLPVPLDHHPISSFTSQVRQFYPLVVDYESPHCKTFLLLQAHLVQLENLPCSDYITDTNSVLDQAIRILQAMIDVCIVQRYLNTAIGVMKLVQCIRQARMPTDSSLTCLPHLTSDLVSEIKFNRILIKDLKELCEYSNSDIDAIFSNVAGVSGTIKMDITRMIRNIPRYEIDLSINNSKKKDGFWLLDGGQKYEISLVFKNKLSKRSGNIYAPKSTKLINEGWWVLFGKDDQALELKRLSPSTKSGNMFCMFRIITPAEPGIYKYTVHIISDGYMGLDQKIDILWRQ